MTSPARYVKNMCFPFRRGEAKRGEEDGRVEVGLVGVLVGTGRCLSYTTFAPSDKKLGGMMVVLILTAVVALSEVFLWVYSGLRNCGRVQQTGREGGREGTASRASVSTVGEPHEIGGGGGSSRGGSHRRSGTAVP